MFRSFFTVSDIDSWDLIHEDILFKLSDTLALINWDDVDSGSRESLSIITEWEVLLDISELVSYLHRCRTSTHTFSESI